MKIIFIFSCSGMFRDVPECSGMFRNVPCSGFYRRPKRMFIELLARMCNVVRLGSEVCNWLPASYLEKKEYSLHFAPSLRFTLNLQSAFYTLSAFYPWSAVCSLQSAVCILHWPFQFQFCRRMSLQEWGEISCQVVKAWARSWKLEKV